MKCTREALIGKILAHQIVDQGPLFKEAQIKDADMESKISAARTLNKQATKQVQAHVNIGEYDPGSNLDQAKTQIERGVNLSRTPEAILPKKVYTALDKKMEQWADIYRKRFIPKLRAIETRYERSGRKLTGKALSANEAKKNAALAPIRAEARKLYREEIGKQTGAAKQQIQDIFNNNAADPAKIDAQLKRLGLTRRDAYYTTQYLAYLENGGPYFNLRGDAGADTSSWFDKGVHNLIHNKSHWNIRTAAFHFFGVAQRAPASFGFKDTLQGIVDAQTTAKKAGVNLFQKIPALDKQGVYASDLGPMMPGGSDPLHYAQTFSDNVGYFVGKKAGNVSKGLKDIAYRPKPWNDTSWFEDSKNKNLQFMSFQFRHMQQYGGWVKTALSHPGSPESIKAARSLAIFSIMSGAIFGGKAVIPAPVYLILRAADPNFNNDYHDLLENIPIVGDFANKGLLGEATGIDLSTEAMPLGGVEVGLGGKMINDAIDFKKKAPPIIKELRDGEPGKAALLAVDAVFAFSQLFKGGANAVTQKAVDGVTDAYIHDADFPGYFTAVGKKVFGKTAIPK